MVWITIDPMSPLDIARGVVLGTELEHLEHAPGRIWEGFVASVGPADRKIVNNPNESNWLHINFKTSKTNNKHAASKSHQCRTKRARTTTSVVRIPRSQLSSCTIHKCHDQQQSSNDVEQPFNDELVHNNIHATISNDVQIDLDHYIQTSLSSKTLPDQPSFFVFVKWALIPELFIFINYQIHLILAVTTSTPTTTGATTVTITSDTCTSGWTGVTVFTLCTSYPNINSYQQYTDTYVAIGTQTRIAFALREDVGFFGLDDISVRSNSASTVELLTNGGFKGGTYSSWIYCNPSGSSYARVLTRTSDYFAYSGTTYSAHSDSYYYLDGAVGKADYISQKFATNIGETYTISFWLFNKGSGSNSDFRIILSI
ncbi:unnamed protein product [Rotaria sp. Silwood2]|nr:unnamed protein product [Rotaria sp. Silwood2]